MKTHINPFRLGLALAALFCLLTSQIARGANATLVPEGLEADGSLKLMVNKGAVLSTKSPYKRVNIGSPEVADVNTIAPTSILVTAKKVGSTQLILWDDRENTQTIDIVVSA